MQSRHDRTPGPVPLLEAHPAQGCIIDGNAGCLGYLDTCPTRVTGLDRAD